MKWLDALDKWLEDLSTRLPRISHHLGMIATALLLLLIVGLGTVEAFKRITQAHNGVPSCRVTPPSPSAAGQENR